MVLSYETIYDEIFPTGGAYMIYLCVLLWFVCGFLCYGLSYAYFKNKWPSLKESRTPHLFEILAGPLALVAFIIFAWRTIGFKNILRYGFEI